MFRGEGKSSDLDLTRALWWEGVCVWVSELKIAWTGGTKVLCDCTIGIIVICIGGTMPAFVSVHQLRREAIRGIDWTFVESIIIPVCLLSRGL